MTLTSTSTKACPSCGKEQDVDYKFCNGCGVKAGINPIVTLEKKLLNIIVKLV